MFKTLMSDIKGVEIPKLKLKVEFCILFLTGLRIGELKSLTFADTKTLCACKTYLAGKREKIKDRES